MIDIFSETSILVCRTIKDPILSSAILDILKPNHVFSGAATYSLLEYYNLVVKRIDNVIKKLKSTRNIAKARERVDSSGDKNLRAVRIYQTLLTKVDLYLQKNFDPKYPGIHNEAFQEDRADMAVTFLEDFKNVWYQKVKACADNWADGTRCFWAEHIRNAFPSAINCSCKNIRCGIVTFLESKRAILIKVRDAILKLPLKSDGSKEPYCTDELSKLRSAIDDYLVKPETAAEYLNCRKFADAIQALEAETFQTVYSTNYKEFKFLCREIEKNFLEQHHSEAGWTFYPSPIN